MGMLLMSITGQAVLYLLIIILAARPLATMNRRLLWLVRIRRQLGWLTGFLALSHLLVYLLLYTSSLSSLVNSITTWWGALAWITLLTLGLLTATSNDYSVRKLKRKWKSIHKLTYVVGFLGLAHWFLAVKGFPVQEIVLFGVPMLLLVIWRFKAWRTFLIFPALIYVIIGGNIYFNNDEPLPVPAERILVKPELGTDEYHAWWWIEESYRYESLPVSTPEYSDYAIDYCKDNGGPVSFGKPIYCADGKRGTHR